MSEVKRWKATERPGPGNVVEVVDYSDYAALEAECERLREALEHCSEVMKDPWKHGEGCISRAINRADAALAAQIAPTIVIKEDTNQNLEGLRP